MNTSTVEAAKAWFVSIKPEEQRRLEIKHQLSESSITDKYLVYIWESEGWPEPIAPLKSDVELSKDWWEFMSVDQCYTIARKHEYHGLIGLADILKIWELEGKPVIDDEPEPDAFLTPQSILLHPCNFSSAERTKVGESGLYVTTEEFYRMYGYNKAVEHYQRIYNILKYLLKDNINRVDSIQVMMDTCLDMIQKIDKITGPVNYDAINGGA